ncbi:MAG: hypothetical protein BWX80_03499 [Candidatus Hydrogenedentes bacterium ADurb.Bin101]|nr:MAG: hypothetical protein BWX80_03499 [Candidatus Hydrogenedentes bacterium ADurb.Bin101]
MPMFPKIKVEVAVFSDTMEAGFTAQPLFFPNADVGALQAALARAALGATVAASAAMPSSGGSSRRTARRAPGPMSRFR